MVIRPAFTRNGVIFRFSISNPLNHDRIKISGSKTGDDQICVEGRVVYKESKYSPAIETREDVFEGNDCFCMAKTMMEVAEMTKGLADDLNTFERHPEEYVRKINECIEECSVELLELYLPLTPSTLSDGHVQEALLALRETHLLGHLVDRRDVNDLSRELVQGLIVLLERHSGITISDDQPVAALTQAISSLGSS